MRIIRTKKGVNLPVPGEVTRQGVRKVSSTSYALLADDYPGLKASILIKNGDRVTAGAPLIRDKKHTEVEFISPVTGVVREVIRGDKRAFLGISVDVESWGPFEVFNDKIDLEHLSKEKVSSILLKSGHWTALRTRPFGHVPSPETTPEALFITACDTRPLSVSPDILLEGKYEQFALGVKVLSTVSGGKTYVCVGENSKLPVIQEDDIETVCFTGPHPSGLAGTHIHFLRPVCRNLSVWEIDYQDVANIGELFLTGKATFHKTIALAGKGFKQPELVSINPGANIQEICAELLNDDTRLISGSVLYGNAVTQDMPWLGRFDNLVTALPHGKPEGFLGWLLPFSKYFSVKRIFLNKPKEYRFDTYAQGPLKSMVPVGSYEQVMPLDIIMTPFLRYLSAGDYEMAEKMGALELLEEDLSLSTFVSPEKTDFAPLLRDTLDNIIKEM